MPSKATCIRFQFTWSGLTDGASVLAPSKKSIIQQTEVGRIYPRGSAGQGKSYVATKKLHLSEAGKRRTCYNGWAYAEFGSRSNNRYFG